MELSTVGLVVDVSLSVLNLVLAFLAWFAPWYETEVDTVYQGCPLSAGTVIAPFESTLCGTALDELVDGGRDWKLLMRAVYVYIILSCMWVVGSAVRIKLFAQGEDSGVKTSVVSYITTIGMIVVTSMLMRRSKKIDLPEDLDNGLARSGMIFAVVVLTLRLVVLVLESGLVYMAESVGAYLGDIGTLKPMGAYASSRRPIW